MKSHGTGMVDLRLTPADLAQVGGIQRSLPMQLWKDSDGIFCHLRDNRRDVQWNANLGRWVEAPCNMSPVPAYNPATDGDCSAFLAANNCD